MSVTPFLVPPRQAPGQLPGFAQQRVAPRPPRAAYIRRRGTLEQGRALETLGHAVEYLVDSGMFHQATTDSKANEAAVQILMRLSRAVFLECPEVLPVRRRVGLWGQRLVARAFRRAPSRAC